MRTFFKYLVDPKVSIWRKLRIFLALAYILSPIDLLPERRLGLFGLLDDLLVFLFLRNYIRVELFRYNRANEQKKKTPEATGPTIDDVEYRVHRD